MTKFAALPSGPSDHLVPFTDQLRLAVAGYLARFKGSSRCHTESDLRCYLAWCAERGLDPLTARRPHLELYIQHLRHYHARRRRRPARRPDRCPPRRPAHHDALRQGPLEPRPPPPLHPGRVHGLRNLSRSASARTQVRERPALPKVVHPRIRILMRSRNAHTRS